MAITVANPGGLTDAQARNLIIKALRTTRVYFRRADTIGEKFEREIDRLIKRKTRINSTSFVTLINHYNDLLKSVESIQKPLTDALNGARQF